MPDVDCPTCAAWGTPSGRTGAGRLLLTTLSGALDVVPFLYCDRSTSWYGSPQRSHRFIHNAEPKESVISSPAARSPGYRKFVLRWDERPAAGTPEYEATQSRILQVFREWSTPEGLTIHQFVIRVGDWGGYMVFETDNLADIHFLSTALAGFTFQLEPVIDVMDTVAIELQAMRLARKGFVGGSKVELPKVRTPQREVVAPSGETRTEIIPTTPGCWR